MINSYNSMGYVETITDPKGSIIRYTYDSNGNILEITYPDETKTTFAYDKNGNVIKSIDAKGNVTKYQYDNMDRLIAVYNALNGKKTVKYTPSDQVSEVIDENGNKTQYKYDEMDRLVEVIDAKNNSTRYVYDKVGNLTEVHRFGGVNQDVKDSMTKVGVAESVYQPQNVQVITKYEYNPNGLLTKEINPGGKVTIYDYDNNGNIISKTDSDGYTTQFEYDVLDNITKVKYNDGKEVNYGYNSLGYLTKLQDWLGTTNFEVDALGQILKVNDYMDKTIEYSWSPTGEKLSMKYPDGSQVKYDYDSMGRLTKVTDADKLSTTYKYDVLGNLTEKLLPNGIKTEYTYDSLSRIIKMNNKDNKGKILDAYTYIYDAVGNKTEINRKLNGGKAPNSIFDEVDGRSIYEYDELNQLISVLKPNNTTDKYFYDNLGNRIRHENWIRDKIVQSADYVYDIEGRLIQIAGSNRLDYKGKDVPDTLDFEYDNRGNLLNVTFDNKVISQYSFDSTNKMESAVNYLGDETTFQYDGLGRRVELKVKNNVLKPTINFENVNIKMDRKGETNGNDRYSICQNWLGDYNGFDSGRNKSSITKQTFAMDVTSPYNDVLITDCKNGTSQRYTYGLDIISSEDCENIGKNSKVEKLFYLQDELGSTIGLVDNKGKYVERYSYDEFGRPIKANSSQGIKKTNNSFGFTGYQYDESTGLYFAQARYYMPEVGRFMSKDSYAGNIIEPLSLNLYTYVKNNPVKYLDPSGYTYLSVEEANAKIAYWKAMYSLGKVNNDKDMMDIASILAEVVRSKVNGDTKGLIEVDQPISGLSSIEGVNNCGERMYKSANDIIIDSTMYIAENYGFTNALIYAIASIAYQYYPGYCDLNVGAGYYVGGTGGIMYDSKTGNLHLYLGGGLITPGAGLAFYLAPSRTQGVTTGWNFGFQAGEGGMVNVGDNFNLNSPFLEVGVGTPGVSLTAYYVFEPLTSTGDLNFDISIVKALADKVK
mgnify:CR=1 FL=1